MKGRLDAAILKETKEELIENLHLRIGDYFTNAAALLFAADPEKWIPGAFIKVGYFETDADLVYQDEVRGSLFLQIDTAIELIYFKYLKAKITYSGLQRIERYPFPEEALREALLNAVVHKDYSSGIPVQISVYDDKLYIGNTGKLPENWTLESLMNKHTSRPFNPNIAHVFYLAGYIESWGRGIEKIYDACRKDEIFEPEYILHPGDIMIKFTAPLERIVKTGIAKVTERVTEKVTEKEIAVLEYIIEDPGCTMDELALKVGVSRKTIALRIKALKDSGVIVRVGATRNGYWRILNGDKN